MAQLNAILHIENGSGERNLVHGWTEQLRCFLDDNSAFDVMITLNKRGIQISYPSMSNCTPDMALLLAEALMRAARIAKVMEEEAAKIR